MKCKEYETKSGKPIRLWQGDCMELMEQDTEWGLAICDPPYGTDITNQSQGEGGGVAKKTKYKGGNWDKDTPQTEYFNQLRVKTKNRIIWGGNYFTLKNLQPSQGWIVWDKLNGDSDFADCELAYTSFDRAIRKFSHKWAGMLQHNMKNKQDRIHPTEKPIRLYRWLLQNYAEEDDTILDTHGGSMSLAIACYIEDYELDIIELDEDYYNDAVERFEQHISQKTLF